MEHLPASETCRKDGEASSLTQSQTLIECLLSARHSASIRHTVVNENRSQPFLLPTPNQELTDYCERQRSKHTVLQKRDMWSDESVSGRDSLGKWHLRSELGEDIRDKHSGRWEQHMQRA